MAKYLDLELPGTNVNERVEWAGERYADLCEGLLERDMGWFIWGVIVGWSDVGTADEKRQYRELGKNFEQLLRQLD